MTILGKSVTKSKSMERTLLINTTFEPISLLSWKKAITLVYLGKVEVLEEYEREIRGASRIVKQPAVVRLLKLVRNNYTAVKFSRKNIFLRDGHTCQYCGEQFEAKRLTCDHIVPRSRGGITEWTNVVTSCISCNLRKGNKLPEEAKMFPMKKPSRPNRFYIFMLHLGMKVPPEYWRQYLFSRD